MTSPSELLVRLSIALALAGCGLTRPADPPPFDCDAIDRADERFPDECGEPEPEDEEDAGAEDEEDAGAEDEEDAGELDGGGT
jgi:hypothetical protein